MDHDSAKDPERNTSDSGLSQKRIDLVKRAIDHWRRQLIDPSRRNNLLFYKDTRTTTLRLDALDRGAHERLVRGREVPLLDFVPAHLSDEEREDLQADLKKRATTIFRYAQANREEAGLETLYLGLGLATWPLGEGERSRDPAAPVLLLPLTLQPKGAGGARSFSLVATDEAVINPVLVHALHEWGIHVDPDALCAGVDGLGDGEAGLQDLTEAHEVYRRLADQASSLARFRVDDCAVLGNFQYYKMAMVDDLDRYVDQLCAHPIIGALAGDDEARREAIPEMPDPRPREFDFIPASEQDLILDADSSQELAIRRVLAGQSIVVQGPPGTGKSQTIANLMAALTAEGKRVLFVAEKRAALDAVKKRLDASGLGHLILDLHGGGVTKKKLAGQMATALLRVRESQPDAAGELYRQHDHTQRALRAHLDSMHEPRSPAERSIYGLRCEVLGTPEEARISCTWTGAELGQVLTAGAAVHDVIDDLREFSDLMLSESPSPWSTSTVTEQDVGEGIAVMEQAWTSWQRLLQALQGVDRALAGTESMRQLGELRMSISAHLAAAKPYNDSVWNLPLEGLTRALRPGLGNVAKRFWVFCTNKDFRTVRQRLLTHRKAPLAPWGDLPGEAARIESAARAWRQASERGSPPSYDSIEASGKALEAFLVNVASAAAVVPAQWTSDTKCGTVEGLLQDMVDDKRTPYRRARLTTLLSGYTIEMPFLAKLLKAIRQEHVPAGLWIKAFDYTVAFSSYDLACRADPAVQGFDGKSHERTVDRFKGSDRQLLEATALRVIRNHAARFIEVCNQEPGQDALLRREAQKKTRHLPLRKLLDEAPDVLTALFPCWLASPLSVSQLLSGASHFDVVLFDEASQVFPHDAVPSVLRGRQLVVAGDRHQLPPTDFFQSNEDGGDSEEVGAAEGFESLLDQVGSFLPNSPLNWHYRSRDERLIAFCNQRIYDGSLITFPGPGTDGDPLRGVVIPFRPEAPESTKSGGDEVRQVVALILEHAAERPHESLGVIAPGLEHARRLEAELDQQLTLRPDLEEFFDAGKAERFFVKNLERVQGDERDAIIFSVGYAKDRAGNLPHRFGPITQSTGHRRLNVAASRARRRMTVVSSFRWDEIDFRKSDSRGVRFLRDFLRYAESGGTVLSDDHVTHEPLNPFEKDIFDELTAAGIPLTPQYGSSGYRIDMVAAHPDRPGRCVLAIECDGASYHSAPIARERDRLRQQVLESLGWRFHRIWSTDWWNQRHDEIERAVQAYQRAVRAAERGEIAFEPDTDGGDLSVLLEPQSPVRNGTRPRIVPGRSIQEYPHRTLVALVRYVRSDGRLRTDAELMDELVKELGFSRKGARIASALQRAIDGA